MLETVKEEENNKKEEIKAEHQGFREETRNKSQED